MPQPLRVFFSYAHEDDRFRIRLEKSLRLLERQGLIESWHDRKLLPGDDWAREIDGRLEKSEADPVSDQPRLHRLRLLLGRRDETRPRPPRGRRFAAQVLARVLLGRPELAAEHLGLAGEPPFPVFVPLNRFAEFLAEPAHADPTCPPEAPEHFLRYLDFALRGHSFGLPEGYLRRRVEAGGCQLLLDGLDEVPGALRPRVARIVERVVIESPRENRHLLTCRTRAYEGATRLSALPSFRLAPFEPAQVARFVEAWSRALLRVPAVDPGEEALRRAEDYRRELQAQIDAHPNIGPLTESPLMLTMLAVVHWSRKRLPEQRVELYEAAVDYLLESRREQSPFPATLRREALQALALRMFEDAEGVQRSLGRREAAAAVEPALAVTIDEAEAYLEGESLHSGLLVSRTDGEVEFWHLTFQEYLAAVDLARDEDSWSTLAPHLFDDRWAEVVLLFAGWLRWRHGQRPIKRLIERVLATASDLPGRARAVGLLGRVLRDVRPFGGDPAAGTGYEAALAETLALFTPGGPEVQEKLEWR